MKKVNVGVVGVTGLVGQTMLKVLESYDFPIHNLYVYASSRSAGKAVTFKGKDYTILELNEHSFDVELDIVLFAVESEFALKYAKIASQKGIYVIDNSSAFRMYEDIPLIVPEVNIKTLKKDNYLIANPNCSTIQSVVALKVIDDLFGLEGVDYTSYQAVSGSGLSGILDLERGIEKLDPLFYPKPIYMNVIPQIDSFLDNGFTKEEMKMVLESNKILGKKLDISATCVRVPVHTGHSVSIHAKTLKDIDLNALIHAYKSHPSIVYYDQMNYPTPLDVVDHDEVYVGRLRLNLNHKNQVLLWTVSDNVRKGAASNAVQIAQYILKEFL